MTDMEDGGLHNRGGHQAILDADVEAPLALADAYRSRRASDGDGGRRTLAPSAGDGPVGWDPRG